MSRFTFIITISCIILVLPRACIWSYHSHWVPSRCCSNSASRLQQLSLSSVIFAYPLKSIQIRIAKNPCHLQGSICCSTSRACYDGVICQRFIVIYKYVCIYFVRGCVARIAQHRRVCSRICRARRRGTIAYRGFARPGRAR